MGFLSDLGRSGFLEPLAAIPILITALAISPEPKMNGQKPVVRLEESMSYAYDFDGDGKIDAAFYIPIGGTPRVPSYRIPLNSENIMFKKLQSAYDNARK